MQAEGYGQTWTRNWRQTGVCELFQGVVRTTTEGCLVPVEGIEPTLPCGNQILSLARLPIPPHRLDVKRAAEAARGGRRAL